MRMKMRMKMKSPTTVGLPVFPVSGLYFPV
jgi:hypothetical protein